MSAADRQRWLQRQKSGLYAPAAAYSPRPSDGCDVTTRVQRPARQAQLSHSDARNAFTKVLVEAGIPRKRADAIALDTSARACRKEGYKL